MKTLFTILDAARDEVARLRGFSSYQHRSSYYKNDPVDQTIEFETASFQKAMENQYNFLRWLAKNGYRKRGTKDIWWNRNTLVKATELELYEIWEGQK